MCKLLGSRNDHGLYLGSDAAVGIGDGAFVLEIEHVAHSSDDMMDAELTACIYCEAVVFRDTHALHTGRRLTDYVHALVHVEEAAFILVDTDRHHYLVEHREGSLENIEMACGKRIERPGEECCPFHNCQSIGVLP